MSTPTALVDLRNAHYRYPKANADVFAHLQLQVQSGEKLALIGPSGGGKSTLLYVLAGMLRLGGGQYRFGEQAISEMNDTSLDAWRSMNVGFVYQQAALLPHLSLLDNVLLPVAHERAKKIERHERARALLGALDLADLWKRLPSEVSGGQAQRASIARALVRAPKLVLADEPTSALDDAAAATVMEVLQTACGTDTTLVLATHDARLLQRNTRVLPMGELVNAGRSSLS